MSRLVPDLKVWFSNTFNSKTLPKNRTFVRISGHDLNTQHSKTGPTLNQARPVCALAFPREQAVEPQWTKPKCRHNINPQSQWRHLRMVLTWRSPTGETWQIFLFFWMFDLCQSTQLDQLLLLSLPHRNVRNKICKKIQFFITLDFLHA